MSVEVNATYQGIQCARAEATRTPGLESDAYSVVIPWDSRAGAVVIGNEPIPALGLRARDAKVRPGAAARLATKLARLGDLTLDWPDRPDSFVRLQDLFVRDDGVRVLSRDEREKLGLPAEHLVQLELVDVRYPMPGRGCLFGDFNIVDRKGGGFYANTMDKGQPHTLQRFIMLLLALLPGNLPLLAFPEFVEAEPIEDLSYRFDDPWTVLADTLDRHGLVFGLTPDNAVTLDELEVGEVGMGFRNAEALPTTVERSSVTVFGPSYRPDHIIVAGPPAIATIQVPEWEAVGLTVRGEVAPVKDALESYTTKVTVRDMEHVVLYPDAWATSYLTVFGETTLAGAQAIIGWFGRMWRPKNMADKATHLTPMLDRAETDEKTGERLPILVEARVWADVTLLRQDAKKPLTPDEPEADEDKALEMADVAELTKEQENAIATFASDFAKRRGAKIIHLGEPTSDRVQFRNRAVYLKATTQAQALVEFVTNVGGSDQERFVIAVAERGEKSAFEVYPLAGATEGNPGIVVEKPVTAEKTTGKTLARTENPTPVTLVNVGRSRIESGDYELDRERAILTFKRPVGEIEAPGGDLKANRLLIDNASIAVTYGVALKSNPNARVPTVADHWVAAYDVLDASPPIPGIAGTGGPAALKPASPRFSALARVVRDPTLQWFIELGGSSNRADLEARSMQLAIDAIGRAKVVETTTTVLAGVYPVETNGKVMSVSWRVSADPGEASTTILIGTHAGFGGNRGWKAKRVTTQAAGYAAKLDAIDVADAPAQAEVARARANALRKGLR